MAQADDFWVLARSAVYLGGKGVTFGPPLLTQAAINPHVYSIPVGIVKSPGIVAVDSSLGVFADNSLDHVLVTPQIGSVVNPRVLLEDATRKLHTGGHLILLQDVEKAAPLATVEMVSGLAHWVMKCEQVQNGKHLLILKKAPGRRGIEPLARSGRPRACVSRYGALGDAIIMSPLVRQLAADGYEVTLNISSYCLPVFEGNPHVSNILVQERDLIPNHLLGRYWQFWETQYDRYINLSESLEGDLLMVEGRGDFFTSKEWRHRKANRNYYDYTMLRGGYPEITGTRGELFFTNAEERRARKFFDSLADNFVVVWSLNGSSHHKIYPMMEPLLREWLRTHEDARVITTGDPRAKSAEFGHPQVIPRVGEWSIRESLIATKYAQCVVGPETMMTNAAGCFTTPKIVLLSHSTKENLTKYFLNDYSLEPDVALAPCYPCHQLHYTAESCPVGEMRDTATEEVLGQAPVCSMAITPDRVMNQLDAIYAQWAEPKGMAA